MFLNEIFDESVNPFTGQQVIDDLKGVHPKHHTKIQNLARFHRVDVHFDPRTNLWISNKPLDDHPFIRDVKHLTSAAHHYGMAEAAGPSKKESVLNKGVAKMLAAMQSWQDARDEAVNYDDPIPPRPKLDVAVVVKDYPGNLAYGTIKFIGRTGLVHVKLNGGKLKDWASGDEIAVRPNELYATWDPSLQDKTTVHREYDNAGNRTVREERPPLSSGVDFKSSVAKLYTYINRNLTDLASMASFYEDQGKFYSDKKFSQIIKGPDGNFIPVVFMNRGNIEYHKGNLIIPAGTMYMYRHMYSGGKFWEDISKLVTSGVDTVAN